MTTSSDVPALDVVYKLQEYAGVARRKRSANKATWPGRKQVWRRYGADGRMAGDTFRSKRRSARRRQAEGKRRTACATCHAKWQAGGASAVAR